jgi:hypothetical protein
MLLVGVFMKRLLIISGFIFFYSFISETKSNIQNPLIEFLFEADSEDIAINTGYYKKNAKIWGDYKYIAGIVDDALEFNDSNIVVYYPDDDELDFSRFTIMAWVKPYSRGSDDKRIEIIEKTDSYWMNIRVDDGLLRCGCFFSNGNSSAWFYIDSDRPVPLNEWTHVAFTVGDGQMVSYINGRESARCDVPEIVRNTTGPFAVGSRLNMEDNGRGAAYFHGIIDELRVFTFPMSQNNITDWMILNRNEVIPPSAPFNLSAEISDNTRLKLYWESESHVEAKEFEIFSSTDNVNWAIEGFTSNARFDYFVTGLRANTDYFFKVRTISTTGLSTFSDVIMIRTNDLIKQGLVAFLQFDNDIADSWGEYHGIQYGNIGFELGKSGFALKMEGDGFIEIPHHKANDFSIAFWLKTTQNEINNKSWFGNLHAVGLVDGGLAGNAADFGTAMVGGKFAFSCGVPDQTTITDEIINNGQWQHLVATYSNESKIKKVYLNGTCKATGLSQSTHSKYSSGMLTIGKLRDHNFLQGYFTGLIDELMIFNRELSEYEVNELTQISNIGNNYSEIIGLNVFPNPAKDFIFVTRDRTEDYQLVISDLQGRLIFETIVRNGIGLQKTNIDFIPEGIYILRLQANKQSHHQKLFISR